MFKVALKYYLFGLCLLLSVLLKAEVNFPSISQIVTDQAAILTPTQLNQLKTKLTQHEQETSNQIVVLIVNSLQGETVEHFAWQTFNKNQLGQSGANNGVLVLLAIAERKTRIEVGYGLEPYLTDLNCNQIIDLFMVPQFKKGNYYKGLDEATNLIIDFINQPETANQLIEKNKQKTGLTIIEKILFSLLPLVFVSVFGFFGFQFFKQSFVTSKNWFIGFLTGKIGLLNLLLFIIPLSMMFGMALIFLLVPIGLFIVFVSTIVLELPNENAITLFFFNNIGTVLLGIILLIVISLVIAALIKIKKEKKKFAFKLWNLDNDYLTVSSKGSKSGSSWSWGSGGGGSSNWSSSSSSSSSFSGGGGSSGGGGASGSW